MATLHSLPPSRPRRSHVRLTAVAALGLLAAAPRAQREVQRIQARRTTGFEAFGSSVAVSGNLAAVGARDERITANYQGRVYVYRRSSSGWVLDARLQAPQPALHDRFGAAVALSGSVLAVGAPAYLSKTSNGAVHVFRRKNGTWAHETVLKRGQWCGAAVALDGSRLVVGAPWTRLSGVNWGNNHAGAAWVFRFDGTKWVEEAMLKASDPWVNDGFGSAVAIQGTRILVGAPGEGDDQLGRYRYGAVYVFAWNGSSWVQKQKIRAVNPGDGAAFGSSLALDGNWAVVGSPGKKVRGIWHAGAAYLLAAGTSGWNQARKLASPWPIQNASFGMTVALKAGLCLVGSGGRDAAGNDHGAAHAWRHGAKGWVMEPAFSGSGAVTRYSHFGTRLALDGATLFAAGNLESQAPKTDGAVWVFDMTPAFRVMAKPLPVAIKNTAVFELRDAPKQAAALLLFGFSGTAHIALPWPGAVLGIRSPFLAGTGVTAASGRLAFDFPIPASALGVRLWVQSLVFQGWSRASASNVLFTRISNPL